MKKVTDEELTEIRELREIVMATVVAVGELHLTNSMLTTQVNEISLKLREEEEKFLQLQEKERVLSEKLQQKYGAGTIDLDTGEVKE